MKRQKLSTKSIGGVTRPGSLVLPLKKEPVLDLLQRLNEGEVHRRECLPAANPGESSFVVPHAALLNAALECATTEVALGILNQVVALEHPETENLEEVHDLSINAIAMLAELQPTTVTEASLAAQMVGTQRLAMTFLKRSTLVGLTTEAIDANTLRATRLMHLFNEQVETMGKLKGKVGQQRVVVEHVTVNRGGQAIVGAVAATKANTEGPGWGPQMPTSNEPHAQRRRGWLKKWQCARRLPESAEVWRADPSPDGLSRAGHAERPLSDAWRAEHGTADA